MSAESLAKLHEAIVEHLLDEAAGDVSMVTHWVIAAAGVNSTGSPMVMSETSQGEEMPRWMTRGLLADAVYEMDRIGDE